jgi:hypothetical protein
MLKTTIVFAAAAITLLTPTAEVRAEARAVEAHEPIAGYTAGTKAGSPAPISLADLQLIEKTLLLGEEDLTYLRKSHDILAPHVDEILDVWYGFVGSNPQLLKYFSSAAGKPDAAYLGAVKKRFGRWILDTAQANYDQAWLDYQFEIGRRHHRTKKNKVDKAAAVDNISFRYVNALIYPITATLKPFLAKGGAKPEEVEKMYQAWVKSVLLQVTLWSYPYVKPGDF